jgi:peptidoglycan/xylan/chitin deacetylase (PgdA/CDA1 family)
MKQVLKRILSFAGYHLKLWPLVFRLYRRRHNQPVLLVLMFHRIVPEQIARRYFIGYDHGISPSAFEFRVKVIGRYFEFIKLGEFVDVVTGRKPLDRHAALLTFDDADAGFFEHVYPILDRNGWPAVVFAPTGLVDSPDRLWHVRVSNIAAKLTDESWREIHSRSRHLPDDIANIISRYKTIDSKSRAAFARDMIRTLNKKSYQVYEEVLDILEQVVGNEDVLGIKCMTWEQLRHLQHHGIEIESHGVSHRKLNQLDETTLRRELTESKKELEQRLGKQVRSICYPAGAYNDTVMKLSAEVGYMLGFGDDRRICPHPAGQEELFRLPRADLGSDDKYGMHFMVGRLAFRHLWSGAAGG